MAETARLKSISRGFGGDTAVYESCDGEITVSVGWALMAPHVTRVDAHGKLLATFHDREYIQPHIALARLGYEVSGAVDFAANTCADSPNVPVSIPEPNFKESG